MAAYLIADITVTEPGGFARYSAGVAPVVARFGGRYLVRGGATTDLEGRFGFDRFVVIEFPDMAAARSFYGSPDYAPLLALRTASATSRVSFAEGTPPTPV